MGGSGGLGGGGTGGGLGGGAGGGDGGGGSGGGEGGGGEGGGEGEGGGGDGGGDGEGGGGEGGGEGEGGGGDGGGGDGDGGGGEGGGEGEGGGGEGCGSEILDESGEDWAALAAMARLSSQLVARSHSTADSLPATADSATDSTPNEAEAAPTMIEMLASIQAVGAALHTQCTPLAPLLNAAGGYPLELLPRLAHLLHLVLPTLAILAQHWGVLLPPTKTKSGGAAEAEEPKATELRSALRGLIEVASAQVSGLQTAIKVGEECSPAACTLLQKDKAEWEAFLGNCAEGAKAVSTLEKQLAADGETAMAAILKSCREVAAALKQADKKI
mmetsp:Transcript_72244/g.143347  ORF Transcript_72244/g.143347 Transcript_72244/m.143347 type:complete len:329 (-) Transcript_72244:495-1481(-)